jgi:quercetin dioxygenase-like cupin family protein
MHTRTPFLLTLLVSLAGSTLAAQEATVRPLRSTGLAGDPGKELTMIVVDYPPGGSSPVHRHDAQAIVYVVEGTIVMQAKGSAPVTLTPGDTWYEGPDDVHVVSRNASTQAKARYVVFLVKAKDAPIVIPAR